MENYKINHDLIKSKKSDLSPIFYYFLKNLDFPTLC